MQFQEVGWPVCAMGASKLIAWHDVRKRRGRGDGDAQSSTTGRVPVGGAGNLLPRGTTGLRMVRAGGAGRRRGALGAPEVATIALAGRPKARRPTAGRPKAGRGS